MLVFGNTVESWQLISCWVQLLVQDLVKTLSVFQILQHFYQVILLPVIIIDISN